MSGHKKGVGASGKILKRSTLYNGACKFIQWREENGGAVKHGNAGRDNSLAYRTRKEIWIGRSRPIDSIVREMGAGRMWGSSDYE